MHVIRRCPLWAASHLHHNLLSRLAHCRDGPRTEQRHQCGPQQAPNENLWDGNVDLQHQQCLSLAMEAAVTKDRPKLAS